MSSWEPGPFLRLVGAGTGKPDQTGSEPAERIETPSKAIRLSESRGVRMGTQAHRDAVELAVDRWNAHDERYFEAYTEDASMHGFPANVPPTVEGIRALFGGMWAAFPDIRVEIEHLGVEDDVAALHFRVRGTHEGEFMGAAPTGNRIDVEVMTFLRFGPEGKIVERWNRMDEVGLMTQLGLMPAPA
jgi:predicted ester cyclase